MQHRVVMKKEPLTSSKSLNPSRLSTSSKPSKPSWLKVKVPSGENYLRIKKLLSSLQLSTVCQEARCPNMGECWGGGTATVMLMGDTCTRGCRFCAVKTGNPKGELDIFEPEKVAYSIYKMQLEYVVLTSVDRDDLPDHGAGHFARTVQALRKLHPKLIVEVLTPDFSGVRDRIQCLVKAKPHVFAHNVETVERLNPKIRDPRAKYRQSLDVLAKVKDVDSSTYTKSSLMLGLGEREEEIYKTLEDLRDVGCDVVTFGQYLQPTRRHLKVEAFLTPAQFERWKERALEMGFLYVASGPLVRSSYRAGEFFMKALVEKGKKEEKEKQVYG